MTPPMRPSWPPMLFTTLAGAAQGLIVTIALAELASLPMSTPFLSSMLASSLAVLLLAAAMFLGLQWLLVRTRWGRIVRATSDDPRIVRLMGVQPERVYNTVMGLALAFAAVAGMLLALRTSFTPYSGVERLLIAFEVVILGGLGSFWGAFAGGMALGVAQLLGLKFDSNAGALYAHLLFFVVLILRPTGLAGSGR